MFSRLRVRALLVLSLAALLLSFRGVSPGYADAPVAENAGIQAQMTTLINYLD